MLYELGGGVLGHLQLVFGICHFLFHFRFPLEGSTFCLRDHTFLFFLRLHDHGVCHLLCRKEGGAHGVLSLAVFGDLLRQHFDLPFQHRVFFVQLTEVSGQFIQKIVHFLHVVPAHTGFGKAVFCYFLRRQHG